MTEYSYRWIRTHLRGAPEERHVKKMEAMGWEPVPPDELPPKPDQSPAVGWTFPDLLDPHEYGVDSGDLRLYRILVERLAERRVYYAERTRRSLEAAEDAWLADNDPRMKKFFMRRVERLLGNPAVPDSEPNRPYPTAVEYYGEAAIAEHPERAVELAEYQANLKANGTSIPLLQQAIDVDERRAKAQTDT